MAFYRSPSSDEDSDPILDYIWTGPPEDDSHDSSPREEYSNRARFGESQPGNQLRLRSLSPPPELTSFSRRDYRYRYARYSPKFNRSTERQESSWDRNLPAPSVPTSGQLHINVESDESDAGPNSDASSILPPEPRTSTPEPQFLQAPYPFGASIPARVCQIENIDWDGSRAVHQNNQARSRSPSPLRERSDFRSRSYQQTHQIRRSSKSRERRVSRWDRDLPAHRMPTTEQLQVTVESDNSDSGQNSYGSSILPPQHRTSTPEPHVLKAPNAFGASIPARVSQMENVDWDGSRVVHQNSQTRSRSPSPLRERADLRSRIDKQIRQILRGSKSRERRVSRWGQDLSARRIPTTEQLQVTVESDNSDSGQNSYGSSILPPEARTSTPEPQVLKAPYPFGASIPARVSQIENIDWDGSRAVHQNNQARSRSPSPLRERADFRSRSDQQTHQINRGSKSRERDLPARRMPTNAQLRVSVESDDSDAEPNSGASSVLSQQRTSTPESRNSNAPSRVSQTESIDWYRPRVLQPRSHDFGWARDWRTSPTNAQLQVAIEESDDSGVGLNSEGLSSSLLPKPNPPHLAPTSPEPRILQTPTTSEAQSSASPHQDVKPDLARLNGLQPEPKRDVSAFTIQRILSRPKAPTPEPEIVVLEARIKPIKIKRKAGVYSISKAPPPEPKKIRRNHDDSRGH